MQYTNNVKKVTNNKKTMDSIKPDSVTGDGWVERGCLLEGVISG
jgi:hypothetical protein